MKGVRTSVSTSIFVGGFWKAIACFVSCYVMARGLRVFGVNVPRIESGILCIYVVCSPFLCLRQYITYSIKSICAWML